MQAAIIFRKAPATIFHGMHYYRLPGILHTCTNRFAMIYKKLLLPFVFFVLLKNNTKAQDFITRVRIEFEKKVNMHRNIQGDNADKIKESIPKYDVTYYNFTYAGGQSLYKYD